jgi:tryptophanyl-tRNA synthetase
VGQVAVARPRVLSGHRPTASLHLGNFEGTIREWLKLQEDHECFFMIADWHALTTRPQQAGELPRRVFQVAVEWLAAGLDPARSTMFVQSHMKEHAELHLLLSMVTPWPWVYRNPTVREMIDDLEIGDSASYGLYGYPVLQAADILLYRAHTVPVGRDQVGHIELCRRIARRFNELYGDVFLEPAERLSDTPMLPGTDGRKMSKSVGNTIDLSDPPEVVREKIGQMFTDPQKLRVGNPGRPEICPIFAWQQVYSPDCSEQLAAECRCGRLDCADDKRLLAERVLALLAQLSEARQLYLERPDVVWDTLSAGEQRARAVAAETMESLRQALKFTPWPPKL